MYSGEVSKIARLARIEILPEEAVQIQTDLERIFIWIEELSKVDTDHIDLYSCLENSQMPERADVVNMQCSVEDVLCNAPDRFEHYFKVPKVVE